MDLVNWTKTDDGNFEARQGNISLRVTNGSTGPAWEVSLDGTDVVRAGSANSLQGAMLKAKHAAKALSREPLP